MNGKMIPLEGYTIKSDEQLLADARAFYEEIRTRRSVRTFSSRPVPAEVIEECIRAAGRAPSGANKQPWYFCAVENAGVKKKIREAAEKEEQAFYGGKAPQEWLDDLVPLGTDASKPFLEEAPWLIAVFSRSYDLDETGAKKKNYYVQESVGLAAGFLLAALHRAGLATLTHTPSPMNFLSEILDRPSNERPFLLVVTGHPAENTTVPAITKKALGEIARFLR